MAEPVLPNQTLVLAVVSRVDRVVLDKGRLWLADVLGQGTVLLQSTLLVAELVTVLVAELVVKLVADLVAQLLLREYLCPEPVELLHNLDTGLDFHHAHQLEFANFVELNFGLHFQCSTSLFFYVFLEYLSDQLKFLLFLFFFKVQQVFNYTPLKSNCPLRDFQVFKFMISLF